MAVHADREHFIPIRVTDLIEVLCKHKGPSHGQTLSDEDQARFRKLARAASSHLHAHYLDQLRRMKDAYYPFDPDSDTKVLSQLSDAERGTAQAELFESVKLLLAKANYRLLDRAELEKVMDGASDWGVDMNVDWRCFDQLAVFVRGNTLGRRMRRKRYRLFKQEQVTVPTFARVVIMLKQSASKRLGKDADTRSVFLKLFKDIPQMDIEMLLPGTRVKMPLLDRFKLGGSTVSSVGYVGYKLSSLSIGGVTGALLGGGGVLALMTLYTPLALVLGYGYKTYASFQSTKQTYMLQLAQSLYYQNLDNNAGVLYRMLDEAEEQETREVLLAYFFLWRYAGDRGWTPEELDDYVELDLERVLATDIDFEIDDAMAKLVRAGIVTRNGDSYRALPIEQALDRLDDIWERYLNQSAPPPTVPVHVTLPAEGTVAEQLAADSGPVTP